MSKRKTWDVAVIGAGASGMMAAITAARRGKSVLLLEHKNKPGKKILSTGNGKCNFTNQTMNSSCYYGNKELLESVLKHFSQEDTLSFFREIGIWPREKNGYYYPNSGQASSLCEALTAELSRCQVTLVTECEAEHMIPEKYGFTLKTSLGTYYAKNVILATGLKAAPKLGSDGTVFPLLKELGHHFTPVLPALCGFEASGMDFKKVSGVRTEADITLMVDNTALTSERGELQLTDYGISGIPVFQISSPGARALYEKKRVEAVIDFLPDILPEKLEEEVTRRFCRDAGVQPVSDSLRGLFNQKLIPVLLQKAEISIHNSTETINDRKRKDLVQIIKGYPVQLLKIRDFPYAQVCTGGIRTEEIKIDTLESRLVPGLYFAGELLDVDGICGGYNLQWAWSSGYTAGNAVGTYA